MGSWVGFGPIWTADSNSTWKTMSDDGFRSVFLSIFKNLVIRHLSPFGYPAFYQAISIKSTFEPITTPLKWVLADAAWKVSASVENLAPVWAGKCKMVPKHWILLKSFTFHDLKFFVYFGYFCAICCPGSAPSPPQQQQRQLIPSEL